MGSLNTWIRGFFEGLTHRAVIKLVNQCTQAYKQPQAALKSQGFHQKMMQDSRHHLLVSALGNLQTSLPLDLLEKQMLCFSNHNLFFFFFLFSMKVLNPLYALHFIDICGVGPGRQDQILLEPHPSWRGWFYSLNVKATSPRFFLSLFCACKKLCEVRSWDSNLSSHSNCVRRRVYVVFPGNAETLLLP